MSAVKVTLRAATREDAHNLFEWRNDPLTRSMSRSRDLVDLRSHQEWLESRLADPESLILVAEGERQPVAVIRFDRRPRGAAEVSINTAPSARGRGFGTTCLIAACEEVRRRGCTSELVAQIHADNAASRRVFAKAGFVEEHRAGDWIMLRQPAPGARPGY